MVQLFICRKKCTKSKTKNKNSENKQTKLDSYIPGLELNEEEPARKRQYKRKVKEDSTQKAAVQNTLHSYFTTPPKVREEPGSGSDWSNDRSDNEDNCSDS